MGFKSLSLMLLLVEGSIQQKDPVANFCRRFGQQTAIVDQHLYLNGGIENFGDMQTSPANITNAYMSFHDLTSSPPQVGMPQLYANLSKNATIPSASGGQLWADSVNKRLFSYGGEFLDPNNPPTSPQEIFSYDVINDNWNDMGAPTQGINGVAYGAGVGVSSIGQGFVYGGWLNNKTTPGWTGAPFATNSLIKYDMVGNKFQNVSGPSDNIGRAEGVMVYVPASNDGLLVNFGGIEVNANGTQTASQMSQIRIHDITSSKWYNQVATGDIPPNRRRFCADAAWAADRSSYNIYLYGGLGFDNNTAGFDDMWILSLPSFKWVNFYKAPSGLGSPHHSLTCNIVNSGQMLVIGGTFPVNNTCDSPLLWGVHNADLGKVSGVPWQVYKPNLTTYSVPPEIIQAVGGSVTGAATLVSPAAGFGNAELAVYFAQHATTLARSPTRAIPSPSGNSTAGGDHIHLAGSAIAGISVGGAVLLSSIIVGACLCLRRRNNNNKGGMLLQSPPPSQPKALPQVPQEHLSPQSSYSHPYRQNPQSAKSVRSQHYQLPTTPEPVELYGSHYAMPEDDMKPVGLGMREIDSHAESPAYHPPPLPPHVYTKSSPNPSQYADATSPYSVTSKQDAYGSPTSTAPTFTTLGRLDSQTLGRSSRPPDSYYN